MSIFSINKLLEEISCHEEMEAAPRGRDPEREEDRAAADRAAEAAPERAGARVKAQEGARVRAGVKVKGARVRAEAVDAAKAVNRPCDMI